jgi:hypothetical protein
MESMIKPKPFEESKKETFPFLTGSSSGKSSFLGTETAMSSNSISTFKSGSGGVSVKLPS